MVEHSRHNASKFVTLLSLTEHKEAFVWHHPLRMNKKSYSIPGWQAGNYNKDPLLYRPPGHKMLEYKPLRNRANRQVKCSDNALKTVSPKAKG